MHWACGEKLVWLEHNTILRTSKPSLDRLGSLNYFFTSTAAGSYHKWNSPPPAIDCGKLSKTRQPWICVEGPYTIYAGHESILMACPRRTEKYQMKCWRRQPNEEFHRSRGFSGTCNIFYLSILALVSTSLIASLRYLQQPPAGLMLLLSTRQAASSIHIRALKRSILN